MNNEFPKMLWNLLHTLRGVDQNDLFQKPAVNDFITDQEKLMYLTQVEQPMDFDSIKCKVDDDK